MDPIEHSQHCNSPARLPHQESKKTARSASKYLETRFDPWRYVSDQIPLGNILPEDCDTRSDGDPEAEANPRTESTSTESRHPNESTPKLETLVHFPPLQTTAVSNVLSKCGRLAKQIFLILDWELFDYAQREMHPGQYLGDMLVATGTPTNSWITRCRDYLKRSSPAAGGPMLHLMESITASQESKKLNTRIEIEIRFNKDVAQVVYERDEGRSYITASGSNYMLTDIINVILWFTATFRPFPDTFDSDVLLSKASVTFLPSETGVFGTISTNPLVAAQQGLCWTRVYRGICAVGFPIPPCQHFNGAEIAFDVMLALAGIIEEVYQGGIASFRGNDHALYPTAVDKNGHTVLWHTTSCEEVEDLYVAVPDVGEGCSNLKPPDLMADYSHRRRHILGYTEKGKISIGTAEYQLQVPNRRSGATTQKNRLCFRKKANINFGTSGMGMVGGGITLELGLTRTQAVRLDPVPSLYRQIHSAASRPLILYDLTGHVGYLVPETSAILYIALSWFSNIGIRLKENELSKLPRADLTSDGGSAARDCIIAACEQNLVLHGVYGDEWKFFDAVQDALAALRSCRGLSVPAEYTKSVWERLHRKDVLLHGWDMADYIANEETMYRQEVRIKMNAADSWVTHIARHPKMLVIFTKDLQPPIVLDQPAHMCRMWNPLPKAELLLCSSPCIKDTMQTCGGDAATGRLTSQECYLHLEEPVHAFQDCTFDGRSRCSRIHVLRSEPPNQVEQLPPEGAVLLGSSNAPKSTIFQPRQETVCTRSEQTSSLSYDTIRVEDSNEPPRGRVPAV